jgi:23S rRNA (guanine745-N1)-methyltransferase
VIAIPSAAHMADVRVAQHMLAIEDAKEERIEQQFGGAFVIAGRQVIEYPLTLSPAALHDFVMMGPTARHHPPAAVEGEVTTMASFVLLRLERRTATLPPTTDPSERSDT